MCAQTLTLDRTGRLPLPLSVLEALSLSPEAEVVIELTAAGLLIRPKSAVPPITARIAGLDLPVADWEQMEAEITEGFRPPEVREPGGSISIPSAVKQEVPCMIGLARPSMPLCPNTAAR